MDQLQTTDGNTGMFKCALCGCLARRPKITTCCQQVYCGPCFDQWLQRSDSCPNCQMPAIVGDGSTGGCGEQRVKKLDHNSTGVQAVLWRVYSNLRVRCAHRNCIWVGDMVSYEQHCRECLFGVRDQRPTISPIAPASLAHVAAPHPSVTVHAVPPHVGAASATAPPAAALPVPASVAASMAPSKATSATPHDMGVAGSMGLGPEMQPPRDGSPSRSQAEMSGLVGGTYTVVRDHQATDESQLSLRSGDLVMVQRVATHGWVYGRRTSGRDGVGWFPTFCLPEATPPPLQTPPPMAPPAGATRVARDYEASDPAQLSVKSGELVYVRQRDESGWTFVQRVSPLGQGLREGWVPEWLLHEKDP